MNLFSRNLSHPLDILSSSAQRPLSYSCLPQVRAFVDSAYKKTVALVEEKKHLIDAMAKDLLHKEVRRKEGGCEKCRAGEGTRGARERKGRHVRVCGSKGCLMESMAQGLLMPATWKAWLKAWLRLHMKI